MLTSSFHRSFVSICPSPSTFVRGASARHRSVPTSSAIGTANAAPLFTSTICNMRPAIRPRPDPAILMRGVVRHMVWRDGGDEPCPKKAREEKERLHDEDLKQKRAAAAQDDFSKVCVFVCPCYVSMIYIASKVCAQTRACMELQLIAWPSM